MSVGLSVTQRRYVKYGDAHYGGSLVDGAYVLGLFGDVATEACIRMDGDEGLFASYSDVQFRAPVLAGDVIEATATVTAVGRRSRQLAFEARVVCRADLVARAAAEHADAVLVSQVVTQRDAHLSNTREMSAAFHAGYGPRRPLLVVGGPRFDELMAGELGVDRIFGRGTTPREVASYLVHALAPGPGGSGRMESPRKEGAAA